MSRVTMKDIAQRAGVARQTVSAILSDENYKVSKDTRQRDMQLVKEMEYQPNQFAKALKTGKTRTVGFFTNEATSGQFSDPYSNEIYSGAADHLSQNGYKPIFHNYQDLDDPGKIMELLESRHRQRGRCRRNQSGIADAGRVDGECVRSGTATRIARRMDGEIHRRLFALQEHRLCGQ